MLRITAKNIDGTYTSDISREELLDLLGKLEDKGLIAAPGKVGDKCYVSQRIDDEPGFKVTEGEIVKVLNSKKEGVRYDVLIKINRYGYDSYYTPRFEASNVFGTFEEAQKKVDSDIAEREKALRHQRFETKLVDAYNAKTITPDIAVTDEEKLWLKQWCENLCISAKADHLFYAFEDCIQRFNHIAKQADCLLLERLVERIIRVAESFKDFEQSAFRVNHYAAAFGINLKVEIPDISEQLQKLKPFVQSFLDIFK